MWKSVVSRPKFWRSLQIKLSKKTFNKRLESERFSLVRSVKLKKSITEEQLERFFLNIRYYNLRGLDVWTDMTSISGDVLSETAVRLEDIKLENSHLTPYQVMIMIIIMVIIMIIMIIIIMIMIIMIMIMIMITITTTIIIIIIIIKITLA